MYIFKLNIKSFGFILKIILCCLTKMTYYINVISVYGSGPMDILISLDVMKNWIYIFPARTRKSDSMLNGIGTHILSYSFHINTLYMILYFVYNVRLDI